MGASSLASAARAAGREDGGRRPAGPFPGKRVQDVIDLLVHSVPGGLPNATVDTVKLGDPSRPLAGVVTTFLATHDVLRQAVAQRANLVITHEPTFYNHEDEVGWLDRDPVYAAKRKLAEDGGLVVFRFHDGLHRHVPDGVWTGMLKQLGWEQYADPKTPRVLVFPSPNPVTGLVASLKRKLGIAAVRVIGDKDLLFRRVGFAPGAMPGRDQIATFARQDLDVLVCGEVREWETSEYVRDAVAQGGKKALIVLGHAVSEEAGMKWLAGWLSARLGGMVVTHLPAGEPFRVV